MTKGSPVSRTRIKICGLTTHEHIKQAVICGADSIGLVFHEKSPRYINPQAAARLRWKIPAFVTVTALFLNENSNWIDTVINKVKPDCLQFHGTEAPDFCEHWQHPYIKVIPMGSVEDINVYAKAYQNALGFLLDSNQAGRQGGSGDTFDWSRIPSTFQYPLILAGGLTPQNVAEAVAQVRPWAVDVSSGVEKSTGVKDSLLISHFCKEVLRVDCQS